MSRWPLPAALLALLLALAAIAPASGEPRCGIGSHPACPTPPDMAIIALAGFETQAAVSEGIATGFTGTMSISTNQARTGTASLRSNPASGASGWTSGFVTGFEHFGLYVATMPSVTRMIAGGISGGVTVNLALNSGGTLSVRTDTTVVGTSALALATGRWYWIGFANLITRTGVLLQIDGIDQVSGTSGSNVTSNIGANGTEASAIDIYFDDLITDNAAFLPPSRVGLAVPISDVSRTDWTNDAAGTTLWSAIGTPPPAGIADTTSGDGSHQVRDATNGTDTFVVNMSTYATLGLTSNDKVLAVLPFAVTGAPSGTSPKAGSLTVSNPTITKASFGNFYSGVVAGTFPSGWIQRPLAITASPTITLASSPQITVTQDTSSTRIAMVCALGLYVAWTPGALGRINTTLQAVARAASY